MCRYNVFTYIFNFHQLTYFIFVSVHSNYLCYSGRKGYSQQNFVAMYNSKSQPTPIDQNSVATDELLREITG